MLAVLAVLGAVCADDQLTREERALVIQLAGLLDLRDLEVEALLARAEGLVVCPGVKKGVAAVDAQDPGSGPGKARMAREYGIPVVGQGVLGEVPRTLGSLWGELHVGEVVVVTGHCA